MPGCISHLTRMSASRFTARSGDSRMLVDCGRERALSAGRSAATSRRCSEATRDETSLRRFLHGLPGVDQVGAEARAAALATRSIKTTSKAWALDTAIRMVDLTTLEGADTPGKVRSLCAKAMRPDPSDPSTPAVAAVCVYPDLVEVAVEALRGSRRARRERRDGVPVGPRVARRRSSSDVRDAVAAGADEIDMVIDRGAFLAGRYGQVFDEIVADARGLRHGAPQGHPRDGRARDARQRAARLGARAARGRRLHQDLDRQGQPGGDAAGRARDAAGGARLRRRDGRGARRQARGRHPREQGGDPLPRDGLRGRRPALARSPTTSASAPRACSTTCCCSATSSRAAATTAPTT